MGPSGSMESLSLLQAKKRALSNKNGASLIIQKKFLQKYVELKNGSSSNFRSVGLSYLVFNRRI